MPFQKYDDKYVGKEDFKAFRDNVMSSLNTLTDLIAKAQPKVAPPKVTGPKNTAEVLAGSIQNEAIFQKMFQEYFDPKDGFIATVGFPTQNNKGQTTSGFTFTISVPEKWNNTSDAYKSLYGMADLRTRVIDPNDPIGSTRDWCVKVAHNLGYDLAKLNRTR